jgi:hypothetical protein
MASCQETPTTGWRGDENLGSRHQGGSGTDSSSTKLEYSRFVTTVRPSQNGEIEIAGPSGALTWRLPGMSTVSGTQVFARSGAPGVTGLIP